MMTKPTGHMIYNGVKIALPFHEAGKSAEESAVMPYDMTEDTSYWAENLDKPNEYVVIVKVGNRLSVVSSHPMI